MASLLKRIRKTSSDKTPRDRNASRTANQAVEDAAARMVAQVKQRLLAESGPDIFNRERRDQLRQQVYEIFNTLMTEDAFTHRESEHIVLARSERRRIADQITAAIIGSEQQDESGKA